MNRSALEQELEIREELFRRQARRSLLAFTQYTFPNRSFIFNWHHKIITDEIEACLDSQEPYNLMLFVPPRHSKSELCSRRLPAYIFGKNPDAQVIFTSYSAGMAEMMSRDAQRIMLSDSYREVFPNTRLKTRGSRTDDNAIKQAGEFSIVNHRGIFKATGIGGGITGRGADIAIIDDPIKNREEAESKTVRESTIEWYRSTLRTRLEKGGRIILLMTRWHVDDLAGQLIKQFKTSSEVDRWRIISLPAIYEKSEYSHPEDNRKVGQALWPAKYNEKSLARIKATTLAYNWNSEYQQRPLPPGGAIIKRAWLQVVEKAPIALNWVRYWDLAVSKKTKADYTASGQMAVDKDGNVFVRKFVREQLEWPAVRRMIVSIAIQERVPVGIEQVSTQKGFVDDLFTMPQMRDINLCGYNVDTDKLTRALPWIARAGAGKFYIVRGKGVDEYIDELVEFTGKGDTHDDQIDWTSGCWTMLSQNIEPEVEIIGEYEL